MHKRCYKYIANLSKHGIVEEELTKKGEKEKKLNGFFSVPQIWGILLAKVISVYSCSPA